MLGSRLSHFEITAKLGEGGMGQVYRATDTKLGREVAIKVLPESLAADAERLARFEREAQVLASLGHPKIAGIHEVGEATPSAPAVEQPSSALSDTSSPGDAVDSGVGPPAAVHFLVMELAEGEDLADRMARGPIPFDEAVPIAVQIAEGLEAAHERGIIHRDLKPANVKVNASGDVKILDFGLARALTGDAHEDSVPDLTQSPTLAPGMTEAGMLLGTAAYMSPEQARGKPVDRRADIWAFGVLLHEMLTGGRLFAGETASDVLAAVLTREVSLGELPVDAPASIRWLLERCLERDPALRLRDIGEARVCLATDSYPYSQASVAESAARGPAKGSRAAAIAGVFGLIGLGLGWWLTPGPPPTALSKVDILLPDQLLIFSVPQHLAPDGTAVLLAAQEGLYVRRLDSVENRLLPGTAGVRYSTWSPDSRELAFATRGQLWRVGLDGRSPIPIATLPEELSGGGGMVWTRDDRILLAGSSRSGLLGVSAGGGEVREIVPLDVETERDFHEISLLPEGRGVLISVHPQGGIASRIDVWTGQERRTILDVQSGWIEAPVYSPPGYILFSRGSASSPELWAVPFSLEELRTTADPFVVARSGATPSVSTEGKLTYVRGHRIARRQPLRVDRGGRIQQELSPPMPGASHASVSPDGTRFVASIVEGTTFDLLLFDIPTQTTTRLTRGPGVDFSSDWSPDGRHIAFNISDRDQVAFVAADGSTEPRILTMGQRPKWLPDSESLVFSRLGEESSWDVWRYWLADGREEPILQGAASERSPTVSADGRWLAYSSDESGREEIYVRGFPSGAKVQVSRRGATEPHWATSGELLFRSDSSLYRARLSEGERLAFAEPELVLSLAEAGLASGEGLYGPMPDGGIVVFREVISEGMAVLTLVENWFAEFQ